MSNRPAPITTTPPQRKLPAANRNAAQILITRPRNVRKLGEKPSSASPLTIALMILPKNIPIAVETVMKKLLREFVNGLQLENFQLFRPTRRLQFHGIAHFLAQ